MDKKFNMDDSYDLMLEFMKNVSMNKMGMGNIYVIKRFSKDGELLDVKFCKNMMTDYGISQFFISDKTFPSKLFIGDSAEGGFNHTTCAILSPIITDGFSATNTSSNPNYAYPLYYDKVSGLVTAVARAAQFSIPATISGIVDQRSITEYGIGTSVTELWTHSWVYTTSGDRGSMIKKPEEVLNIDVYFCMSYYETLITDNWDAGRYTVITTLKRFFEKMKGTIYTYKRGNVDISRSSTTTMSAFTNNQITRYTNIDSFTIMNVWDTASTTTAENENKRNGYFDGFVDWCSGFMSAERELLEVPIEFDTNVTPLGTGDDSISLRLGQHDQKGVPFSQCNITHSYMFNPTTNAWDNEESFLNDSNKWYTETLLQTIFATILRYSNNNTIQNVYVYQNIQTDDPITAFEVNQETVYACEKYWDRETWHLITNLTQVPVTDTNEFNHTMNCRTARYYITTSNSISLIPYRTSEGFVITPTNGRSSTFAFPLTEWQHGSVCDNYAYGWYKWKNKVYDVVNGNIYFMGNSSSVETMTYGKWMCIFQSENNIVNYADMSSLTTQPTLSTMTLTLTKNMNMYSQCYRSESCTGLITLQSTQSNESYLLNLKGDNITSTHYDTTHMCCVYGTDRIAYIETGDTTHIKVYEFGTTNDVIATLDIPSTHTPSVLFGHTNYIYLVSTSSSNFTICYNILTGEATQCSQNMSNFTGSQEYIKTTCVDKCMVLYRNDLTKASQAYYINMDEPTTVGTLEGLGEYSYGPSSYTLRKVHNNSIALIFSTRNNSNSSNSGSNNVVVDMGNFMKGNKSYYQTFSSSSEPQFIPYGEYFIRTGKYKLALENIMPHRIVGSTNCITAINGYKNIRNKQFYTKFTNIAQFSGLPPGDKQ